MSNFAELKLVADTKGLDRGTESIDNLTEAGGRAEKSTKKLEDATSRLAGKMKTMAAAAAGVALTIGAKKLFGGAVREAEQLERNLFRTKAIITATGGAAGRSADQLLNQARLTARATLESTESVMRAQQTMLTFRNIQGDVFDEAIKAATDMSAALGTGLNSSVLQLGKALEGPVLGITALSRSGTVFTEEQREMVKAMVETGQTIKAQKFILGELAAQYGGVAAKEAAGLAGAQDGLAQSVQEFALKLSDTLGLLSRATSFYRGLTVAVDTMANNLERAAYWIGATAIAISVSLAPAIVAATFAVGRFVAGLVLTRAALIRTGIGAVVVGLGELAYRMNLFGTSATESSEAQKALNNALKVYAQTDGPMARAEVIASAKAYVAETKAKLDSAQATLDSARMRQQAGQALLDQNPLTAGNQSGMSVAMAANLEQSQLAVDLLNAKLQRTMAELGRIKPETDGTAVALGNASNEAGSLADGLGAATGQASRLRDYLTALPGALAGAEAEISSLQAGIANLASGGNEASASIERYRAELIAAAGPLDEMPSKIRDMALAGIQQQVALKKKAQELTQEYNAQVTALTKVERASGKVGSVGNVAAANIATALTGAKSAAEGLADTISGTIGAGFRSMVDGTKTVSGAFRVMARDIIAQLFDVLVVKRLVGSVGTATVPGTGLAGLLGGIFAGKSFEDGGFTGPGARSGGLDGRGGFPAILHPNETVIDHTRGSPQLSGTVVIEQNLNFSVGIAQTVRAEVMSMMPQIAEVTKGAVLDARQRGGSFARGMGG